MFGFFFNSKTTQEQFDPINKKLEYFFTYCKIVGKMIMVKSATGMLIKI